MFTLPLLSNLINTIIPLVVVTITIYESERLGKRRRYLSDIKALSDTLNTYIEKYNDKRFFYYLAFFSVFFIILFIYKLIFRPTYVGFASAIFVCAVIIFVYSVYLIPIIVPIIRKYAKKRKHEQFMYLGFKEDYAFYSASIVYFLLIFEAIYEPPLNLSNFIDLFVPSLFFVVTLMFVYFSMMVGDEKQVFEDELYRYLIENGKISPIYIHVTLLDGSSLYGTLIGIGNVMVIRDYSNFVYHIHWSEISYIGILQEKHAS